MTSDGTPRQIRRFLPNRDNEKKNTTKVACLFVASSSAPWASGVE
jgi:hypothetical protein